MPRRRRQSVIEDLFDLASILPWWLGLAIAALSYVLLHPFVETPIPAVTVPGNIAGPVTAQMIRTGALIGQYLLPFVFVFGAGASAVKAYRNKKLLAEAKVTAGSADLMDLSWENFENLVGEAFRERGFSVSETPPGPDGGVDLELRKDGELHLVQCKRWRARKVGVEIVRELYGVMSARGAVGGYVVSSGTFSQEASDFARGRNIELWDGKKLKAAIRQARIPFRPESPPAPKRVPGTASRGQAAANTPSCPRCNANMILRTAKRGANAGQQFWGCSRFPACKGAMKLSSKQKGNRGRWLG
jgi:restriction system protein